MDRQDEIHAFWFGSIDPEKPVPGDRSQLWFGGARETDCILRDKFLADVNLAAVGVCDS